ncbi:MAG: hypothetical protein PVJ39_21100 [Gammaproteobacteria bacterium]|jgi:hypothetical protein
MFGNKDPKKKRFHKGPIPKDLNLFYSNTLYASYADENEMRFLTGVEMSSTYGALGWVLGGLGFAYLLAGIYVFYMSIYDQSWAYVTWSIVPIILILLGIFFFYKEKNTPIGPFVIVDRAKGEIRMPRVLLSPARTLKFDELEAYFVSTGPGRFGAPRHFINMYPYDKKTQKFGKGIHLEIGPLLNYQDAELQWSFLCQYMDKSQHLPMVPQLWDAIIRAEFGGYQDETSTYQKLAVLRHEWAIEMRKAGHRHDLEIEPELDPQSPKYNPHVVDDPSWLKQAAVSW